METYHLIGWKVPAKPDFTVRFGRNSAPTVERALMREGSHDVTRGQVLSGCFSKAHPRFRLRDDKSPAVILCNAPLVSIVRPSLALGILQGALKREGVPTQSRYLNVDFAELIGLDLNENLAERTASQLLIGDWLFAPSVGAGCVAARQFGYERILRRAHGDEAAEELISLRSNAVPAFVDRVAKSLADSGARIVGFSTMFQQTAASLAIARAVKTLRPEVLTVFGGANCHGEMGLGLFANFPEIDFLFTGEADTSFPELVQSLLRGTPVVRRQGVLSRLRPDDEAPPPPIMMNDLPYPEYDDYFERISRLSESGRVQAAVPFEASRGCWWGAKHHCTFCGLNGETLAFRQKDGDRVLAEIDDLRERYGVARFLATDDIISLKHIDTVLRPLADRPIDDPGTAIFFEVKSNLSFEQLNALAAAGVTFVQPGIESLSSDVLQLMRKGVTGWQNVRFLRNCVEIGVATAWSILYGFPGETLAQYERMAGLVSSLEHLQPPMGLGAIRLDRFSPNFQRYTEHGFTRPKAFPAYEAVYDLPDSEIERIAYFFTAKSTGLAGADVVSLEREISRWQALWFDFGRRPVLEMLEIGGFDFVHDTRTIAREPLIMLSKGEVRILDAARPGIGAEKLEHLVGEVDEGFRSALERLARLHLVLIEDGVIVSLVLRPENRILHYDVRATLPYGYLAPRSADTEEVERVAELAPF